MSNKLLLTVFGIVIMTGVAVAVIAKVEQTKIETRYSQLLQATGNWNSTECSVSPSKTWVSARVEHSGIYNYNHAWVAIAEVGVPPNGNEEFSFPCTQIVKINGTVIPTISGSLHILENFDLKQGQTYRLSIDLTGDGSENISGTITMPQTGTVNGTVNVPNGTYTATWELP